MVPAKIHRPVFQFRLQLFGLGLRVLGLGFPGRTALLDGADVVPGQLQLPLRAAALRLPAIPTLKEESLQNLRPTLVRRFRLHTLHRTLLSQKGAKNAA